MTAAHKASQIQTRIGAIGLRRRRRRWPSAGGGGGHPPESPPGFCNKVHLLRPSLIPPFHSSEDFHAKKFVEIAAPDDGVPHRCPCKLKKEAYAF